MVMMVSDGGREREGGVWEKQRGTEATTGLDVRAAKKEVDAIARVVIGGENEAAEGEEESSEAYDGIEEEERRIGGADEEKRKVVAAGDEIGEEEREKAAEEVERVRPERREAGLVAIEVHGGEAEASEVAVGAEIGAVSGGPRVAVVETLVGGRSLQRK